MIKFLDDSKHYYSLCTVLVSCAVTHSFLVKDTYIRFW